MPAAKKNPPLMIFGNPRNGGTTVRGELISADVKAIVYRHASTGELLVHGFGPHGEAIKLSTLSDGVAIRRLPKSKTGIRMIGTTDGKLVIAHPLDEPLFADFTHRE